MKETLSMNQYAIYYQNIDGLTNGAYSTIRYSDKPFADEIARSCNTIDKGRRSYEVRPYPNKENTQ